MLHKSAVTDQMRSDAMDAAERCLLDGLLAIKKWQAGSDIGFSLANFMIVVQHEYERMDRKPRRAAAYDLDDAARALLIGVQNQALKDPGNGAALAALMFAMQSKRKRVEDEAMSRGGSGRRLNP